MYDPQRYNRNTLFTDDLLCHYMLESDLPEIKALCSTDRNAAKLCQSSAFWNKKMMYDNLPIYQQYNNMTEYQRVMEAVNKANEIDLDNDILDFTLRNEDLTLIFNNILLDDDSINELSTYDTTLYNRQDIKISKTLYFYDILVDVKVRGSGPEVFLFRFNKKDIQQIIINLFYYYPYLNFSIYIINDW